jgi:hypothetical protein
MSKILNCVFYSHSWTTLLLKQIQAIGFERTVLIELSNYAVLSQVFLPKPHKSQSIVQLLAHHGDKKAFSQIFSPKHSDILQHLSQKYAELPAPLILAPQINACDFTQIEAIQLCAIEPSIFQEITLLIHYQEALNFASLYEYVDKFHIVWDIADLPTAKLTQLSQLLVEHSLTKERWGGFHLCHHPKRHIEDSKQREAFFESIIDDYLLKFE